MNLGSNQDLFESVILMAIQKLYFESEVRIAIFFY